MVVNLFLNFCHPDTKQCNLRRPRILVCLNLMFTGRLPFTNDAYKYVKEENMYKLQVTRMFILDYKIRAMSIILYLLSRVKKNKKTNKADIENEWTTAAFLLEE